MLKTMLILLNILSSTGQAQDQPIPQVTARAEKDSKAVPSQDVTYLDLSGPDAPESEFPEIVKKGAL